MGKSFQKVFSKIIDNQVCPEGMSIMCVALKKLSPNNLRVGMKTKFFELTARGSLGSSIQIQIQII
jgi:hypothetical protein